MQVTLDAPPHLVAAACLHALNGHDCWELNFLEPDYWRLRLDEEDWPPAQTLEWFRERAATLVEQGPQFRPNKHLTPEQNEANRAGCERAFREAAAMLERALAAWEAEQREAVRA